MISARTIWIWRHAFRLRTSTAGEAPSGAVIVRDGEIIATGVNSVTVDNDPTAHAESTPSGMPAANSTHSVSKDAPFTPAASHAYIASPRYTGPVSARFFYGNTKEDAEAIDFSDKFIYEELSAHPVGLRRLPAVPRGQRRNHTRIREMGRQEATRLRTDDPYRPPLKYNYHDFLDSKRTSSFSIKRNIGRAATRTTREMIRTGFPYLRLEAAGCDAWARHLRNQCGNGSRSPQLLGKHSSSREAR